MFIKLFTRLSFYLFFLSFISINAKAEMVKQVLIEGNIRISEETIKVYGDIEINKDYSEVDLNTILKNLYSMIFLKCGFISK